ncbi:hypothetical protein Tco_0452000 [Tanacetum coccineum]
MYTQSRNQPVRSKGNSPKEVGKDAKGKFLQLFNPLVSLDEHCLMDFWMADMSRLRFGWYEENEEDEEDYCLNSEFAEFSVIEGRRLLRVMIDFRRSESVDSWLRQGQTMMTST